MLKNSPDTFSTQVVYLVIHWLIGEKETDKKKKNPLVCGYYHNIPSNEFYQFLSTGVKYFITTANNIERDKSTCPSFLQFHFTLTDFISHYPLLSVSLASSLLKVSSMFPPTCICITWNVLLILIQLTP